MRERLLWFFAGACCASVAAAFVVWHLNSADQAAVEVKIRTQAAITQQLNQMERRLLAASEQRIASQPPAEASATVAPSGKPAAETTSGDSAPAGIMQMQAADESHAIVEQALRAGVWSNKDADDFRLASARMRDQDRFELTRQLVMAINQDRIQVELGAELR